MDLDLSTIDNGNLQAIVDFNYKKILKNIMDHTTDPNIADGHGRTNLCRGARRRRAITSPRLRQASRAPPRGQP